MLGIEELAIMMNQFWAAISKDFQFFDINISILDIFLTHVIINMLMDIFLDYARGDTNGAE